MAGTPTCSPVVQEQVSGCVKNGQFVCLPWQQPPPPTHPTPPLPLPNPLSDAQVDTAVWKQRILMWKITLFVLFFCPPVIFSFSLFSFCLLPSYCLSLSLHLFHLSIGFSLAISVCLSPIAPVFSVLSLKHFFFPACKQPLFLVLLLLINDHPQTVPYIWIFAFLCGHAYTLSICVCLAFLLLS